MLSHLGKESVNENADNPCPFSVRCVSPWNKTLIVTSFTAQCTYQLINVNKQVIQRNIEREMNYFPTKIIRARNWCKRVLYCSPIIDYQWQKSEMKQILLSSQPFRLFTTDPRGKATTNPVRHATPRETYCQVGFSLDFAAHGVTDQVNAPNIISISYNIKIYEMQWIWV